MTDILLLLPLSITFLVSLFLMPFWIRKMHQIGLVWDDMNKTSSEKVAGSGGIIVVLAFIVGALIFVAYRVFYLHNEDYLINLFALLLVVSLLAGIGMIDDILGWQKGGLSRRSRIILLIVASIPLMAINAGGHTLSVPFYGSVNFGLFYALFLIPLAIAGASSTFNFLAGFNGLEAGQGIILMVAFAIVSHSLGFSWLSVIALCMTFSLLAFLLFNFSPAKVFPGNSITLVIGGLLAIMSILGNFEKIAVFFFIPYIIEVLLKSRGKLVKQSFGKPNKDGSLDLKYDKLYGLTHVSIALLKKMKIKPTERLVVYSIWLFQIAIILIGFLIFKKGIFG